MALGEVWSGQPRRSRCMQTQDVSRCTSAIGDQDWLARSQSCTVLAFGERVAPAFVLLIFWRIALRNFCCTFRRLYFVCLCWTMACDVFLCGFEALRVGYQGNLLIKCPANPNPGIWGGIEPK